MSGTEQSKMRGNQELGRVEEVEVFILNVPLTNTANIWSSQACFKQRNSLLGTPFIMTSAADADL